MVLPPKQAVNPPAAIAEETPISAWHLPSAADIVAPVCLTRFKYVN